VAIPESETEMTIGDGRVILKKRTYHWRVDPDAGKVLSSARKNTQREQKGTRNQLIPPCPE
jgi:hypothetical protein